MDLSDLARTGRTHAALADGDPPSLVVAGAVAEGASTYDRGEAILDALRAASARPAVRALGRDEGYRVEDLEALTIAVTPEHDGPAIARWLARRLARDAATIAVIARAGAPAFAARFGGRVGRAPTRTRYAAGPDGRVRVEAFELHVVEHCNLRCANCCNMSPLVAERVLAVDELAAFVTRMAAVLHADVVKIMGGEPLLHPELARVIRVLRASGIGDRVRLFTNGLLLAQQDDAFWDAVDELTISSYTSAPVKPATLALARARARRHDLVLNVKPVDEFAQVLSPRYEADDARVAQTFARCWLRHRCLVVRGGRFYTCTKAAYADDFFARAEHEPPPAPLDRTHDGLPLDHPDLAGALAAYLNSEAPLGACRYCFGGDGATEPHYQLSRADVAAGRLSRALAVVR